MPLHSATPADMRDRAPPGHARRCARRPSVLIPGRMEQNRIGRVRNKPARQMWEGPAVGWRRIPFDETRRANIRRESAGSYIRFPYYRYGVGRMPRNGGARRRNELRASPLTFLDVGVGPPVFGRYAARVNFCARCSLGALFHHVLFFWWAVFPSPCAIHLRICHPLTVSTGRPATMLQPNSPAYRIMGAFGRRSASGGG